MEPPRRIETLREYASVELARRHRSTAGSQEIVDPARLDALERDLRRDGFIIVPDVVAPDLVREIRDDVRARFVYPGGRNSFEGMATQRLYSVMEKTFVCNPLVEHPLVLGLLDRLFRPNYLLSQLQVIDILPGECAQPLHFDDAFYPFPRPRPALGAASIFAIDEFTADNGATVYIPGSHEWEEGRTPTPDDERVPAVMAPGSMLFFLGTLWHGGGANRTEHRRLCATAQYCEPFLRTQENYSLSVSRERVAQCSPHVQRLLGYSIHAPFCGMVDGKHPLRLLD